MAKRSVLNPIELSREEREKVAEMICSIPFEQRISGEFILTEGTKFDLGERQKQEIEETVPETKQVDSLDTLMGFATERKQEERKTEEKKPEEKKESLDDWLNGLLG